MSGRAVEGSAFCRLDILELWARLLRDYVAYSDLGMHDIILSIPTQRETPVIVVVVIQFNGLSSYKTLLASCLWCALSGKL